MPKNKKRNAPHRGGSSGGGGSGAAAATAATAGKVGGKILLRLLLLAPRGGHPSRLPAGLASPETLGTAGLVVFPPPGLCRRRGPRRGCQNYNSQDAPRLRARAIWSWLACALGTLGAHCGAGEAGSGGRLGIPGLSRSLSSGLRGSGLEVAGRWALHEAAVARSPQLRWGCGGQWRACVRAGPDCGRLGGPGKAERGWSRSGVTRPGPGAAGGGDAGPLASVAFCRPPARVSGVPTWPGAELSGPSPRPKAPSLPAGTCRHFSSRPSPLPPAANAAFSFVRRSTNLPARIHAGQGSAAATGDQGAAKRQS